MDQTPPPMATRLAALLAAALAACAGGGAPGGPLPLDPGRPGDPTFAEGLSRYEGAAAEAAAGFAAQAAGDAAGAAAHFGLAATAYGEARAALDRLLLDPALCPATSPRCDEAAYLAGRSSYEVGALLDDRAAFEDARARLDGLQAAYPASARIADAAYFDGRARFQLASGFGVGAFDEAERQFERSLAADPRGAFADNAQYYDGRCGFERGIALVTPLSPGAGTAAFADARARFDEAVAALGALPVRFPTSSYRDNAAYYLGRSWLEKPCDGATAAGDAERLQNLGNALDALRPVAEDASSTFRPGALYWRGRASYARAGHPGAPPTDLANALADFHAVLPFGGTVWRDNALAYAVRTQVRQANCAGACADLRTLRAEYPASSYTASAEAYFAANGCPPCP